MHKKLFIAVFLGICTVINAQFDTDQQALIEKEKKGFLFKMGTGNINPNTLNYDLKYQRLDLTLNPGVYHISGSATNHFVPNQSMQSIYFDLTPQLTVSQVTKQGVPLTFQQLPTNEIKIDFPTPLPANTLDSLTIHYSGAPAPTYNAFAVHTQNSVPVMSTLSEPYGAQDWFPTKQSMNDKIERFDFKIITPQQYSVAANGILMSETALPAGQKLTFWRTQYPITAYLAAFSITNFTRFTDTIGNPPFPFINYVYPASATNPTIMDNIEWTKQAMTLFETYFGEYPFRNEKYGHMEFGHNGVCMEHQTMSSMSSWGKYVIAHELAHQWFGNKVTCGTWNDIWLNEGFATFGEHLANEKLLMNHSQFMDYLEGQKNYITNLPGGSTYVPDAQLGTVSGIFNGRLSYAKGGYIVRMMKWVLGETAFFQAIQDYHQRPHLAYNYAVTNDLKASLLQSTSVDFTEFFNDWLYGQGYPSYTIKWKQAPNQSLILQASQVQSHPSVSFFEMPLPIKVTGTNGEVEYLKLENTFNNQYFTVPVNFTIATVDFNDEHQLLERNSVVMMDANLSTLEGTRSNFRLYPVPAEDEIYMEGLQRRADYQIHNQEGRLVQQGKYMPERPIDISGLVSGFYIISVDGKQLKFTRK